MEVKFHAISAFALKAISSQIHALVVFDSEEEAGTLWIGGLMASE
jgi:hypothetical protein